MPEEELEEAKEKTEKKKSFFSNIPTPWLIGSGILIAAILYSLYFKSVDIRKGFWWIVGIGALIYFLGKKTTVQKDMLNTKEALEMGKEYMKWFIRNNYIPDNTNVHIAPWGDLQKVEGKSKYYTFSLMLRYVSGKVLQGKLKVDAFSGNTTIQQTVGHLTGREFPEIVIPTYMKKAQQYLSGGKKQGWL